LKVKKKNKKKIKIKKIQFKSFKRKLKKTINSAVDLFCKIYFYIITFLNEIVHFNYTQNKKN